MFRDEWEAFTNGNVILGLHQGQMLTSRLEDQESQLCVDWISTMSFYSRQVDMLNRRQEGTGEWLFQSEEFKTWLTGAEKTLWCSGLRKLNHNHHQLPCVLLLINLKPGLAKPF
jgi:hypothetical protein